MRTVTINRKSWHYRLMSAFDGEWRASQDLCCYLRGLLGVMLLTLMLAVLGFILIGSFGDLIAWALFCIVSQSLSWPSLFATPAMVVVTLALVIGAGVWIEALSNKLPDEQRQFLDATWESIHDKVCFRTKVI